VPAEPAEDLDEQLVRQLVDWARLASSALR
jgi:hypothetical protein